MDRQVNMRALNVWGSNRDTLESGQVMHILQYWIPKYSFVSYLSISSFPHGLRIITRIWEDSKIIKKSDLWAMGIIPTFPYDHQSPECLSPMLLLSLAFSSELLFSPVPRPLTTLLQEDLLKTKSSHITGQLSTCHFLPVRGWGQSACLPSLLPFIPEFFSRLSHPEPLLSAHIPSPL